MALTRYRATVAYDGSAYQGFQRQAGDTPTVQRALEKALKAVSGQQATVIGAGRTDAGVHARGQVIAFDIAWRHDDATLLRALNAVLPDDIALQDLCQQPGFHPRFDARSRGYSYTVIVAAQPQPLLRGQSWRWHNPLDFAAMQAGAALLLGQHDFAGFGQPPQGENTVREVFASRWERHPQPYGECLTYHVEANAFLQHMVRRMVGALVDVGRGAWHLGELAAHLRAADLANSRTMAPPQGLVLEFVRYNE